MDDSLNRQPASTIQGFTSHLRVILVMTRRPAKEPTSPRTASSQIASGFYPDYGRANQIAVSLRNGTHSETGGNSDDRISFNKRTDYTLICVDFFRLQPEITSKILGGQGMTGFDIRRPKVK